VTVFDGILLHLIHQFNYRDMCSSKILLFTYENVYPLGQCNPWLPSQ